MLQNLSDSLRDLFQAIDMGTETDPDTFQAAYAFNLEAQAIDLATYALDLEEERMILESETWDPDLIDPQAVSF